MINKLENISASDIKLFVRINGADQQVRVLAGESITVDEFETPTMRIFNRKGIITINPIKNDAEMTESKESKLLSEEIVPVTPDVTPEIIEEPTNLETVEEEVKQYVEDGFVKGAWSDEDEEFLKKNYPTKGRSFCSSHLNRNETSVQKKINSLGLKKRKKRKK